jgi:hypothetical protein
MKERGKDRKCIKEESSKEERQNKHIKKESRNNFLFYAMPIIYF